MNSRGEFFRKTVLPAGVTAMPVNNLLADNPVQTAATTTCNLPFKSTYVKNVFVTKNDFRNTKPNIVPSPGYIKAIFSCGISILSLLLPGIVRGLILSGKRLTISIPNNIPTVLSAVR
jgi:hypothetical protein